MHSVLIVEDEFLVALDLEGILSDAGYAVIGLAPDRAAALALPAPRVALVDLNLRDGATGSAIAHELAARGTVIVYMTANPAQIGQAAATAIGMVAKPFAPDTVLWALALAANGSTASPAPADFVALERRVAA